MVKTREPRVLLYDLEVSPCVAWVWGSGQQFVGAHQLMNSGKIICIAYSFSHWEPNKVKHLMWDSKQDDKTMLEKFLEVAAKADVIVGHNGDSFDKKWVNARCAYHNLPTLQGTITEDTYRQMKREFRLPSFKLGYVCKYFNIPGKLSTNSDLWQDVTFRNDRNALKDMVAYCDNDVLILKELYKRMFPYVVHKINRAVFNGDKDSCPRCGSKNLVRNGCAFTSTGKYRRYRCNDCHSYHKDGTNLLTSKTFKRKL